MVRNLTGLDLKLQMQIRIMRNIIIYRIGGISFFCDRSKARRISYSFSIKRWVPYYSFVIIVFFGKRLKAHQYNIIYEKKLPGSRSVAVNVPATHSHGRWFDPRLAPVEKLWNTFVWQPILCGINHMSVFLGVYWTNN